jgi:hypothetical protein
LNAARHVSQRYEVDYWAWTEPRWRFTAANLPMRRFTAKLMKPQLQES